MVKDEQPFHPARDCIVVPRQTLDGLITALHIRFGHLTRYQSKQIFIRHFYALDIEKALEAVDNTCHFLLHSDLRVNHPCNEIKFAMIML